MEQHSNWEKIVEYAEIQSKLQPYNLSKVAEATGLSYFVVRSIARGVVKKPSYEAVKAIADYLESQHGR